MVPHVSKKTSEKSQLNQPQPANSAGQPDHANDVKASAKSRAAQLRQSSLNEYYQASNGQD